jgi:hypothetical protein
MRSRRTPNVAGAVSRALLDRASADAAAQGIERSPECTTTGLFLLRQGRRSCCHATLSRAIRTHDSN